MFPMPTRFAGIIDKLACWLAWKLPRSLAYWCFMRVGAHATTGEWEKQVVPDLLFMDAATRWE